MLKPTTAEQKRTSTTVETIKFTRENAEQWLLSRPGFQREIRSTPRTAACVLKIKADGGVLPGILTLGKVKGDTRTFVVDGQHRLDSFIRTDLPEGWADVRHFYATCLEELADEHRWLNAHLVAQRPDDRLRAMEFGHPNLRGLREACPFVGYDQVRRSSGANSPVVSMSALLRQWSISSAEVPTGGCRSAEELAEAFSAGDRELLTRFLRLCETAWSRDPEYGRLWGSLNLGLCMWLYRRLVVQTAENRMASARWMSLTDDQFRRCLQSLSADSTYLDWLVGRQMTDRDRAPGYRRIKAMMQKRLREDGCKVTMLPSPAWVTGHNR